MTNGAANLVTIRDIDVPFWRIVIIMIKWSIAAIPATIILVLIWLLVGTLFAALFGTLNSCADGVAVVNIDNGFGAGCMASLINHGARG